MTFRRKISVVAALAIATTAAVSTQANAAAVGRIRLQQERTC
ncbi:hypothetical protein GM51_19835 [freshwater metagenome]|uniref:Uncharacterized protein n=1 Tax=freshwater metagenome TaxID=449393 RepID=A0A094S6A2_9ZZZZ